MKPYTSSLENLESNVYGLHFKVSNKQAAPFIDGADRRILCEINGIKKIHSSFMPLGNGDWYILVSKALAKELKIELGQEVSLIFEKDHSKYGMEVPEEFLEILHQDIQGSEYFHKLTPGKQRNLIYIVAKVKNSNSRINKGLAIMHHLKEMNGKLDFKILNETLKSFNKID